MRLEDEGVVGQQRHRIGGKHVQQRIAKLHRRLNGTWAKLLAENVGDVIGAECAALFGSYECGGNRIGPVLGNEMEQLGELPRQRAACADQAVQIRFHGLNWHVGFQVCDQPPLRLRTRGRWLLRQQFFFETLGTDGLATPPRARINNEFFLLVVERHGRRIRFHNQMLTNVFRRRTVAVAIEVQADILIYERLGVIAIVGSDRGNRP